MICDNLPRLRPHASGKSSGSYANAPPSGRFRDAPQPDLMTTNDQPPSSDFPFVTAPEFIELMGGDKDVCAEIIDVALQECLPQIEAVQALQAGASADSVARALHSLRGSSATFGASSFGTQLRDMESQCQAGDTGAARAGLKNFNQACLRYREELRKLAENIRAIA